MKKTLTYLLFSETDGIGRVKRELDVVPFVCDRKGRNDLRSVAT